MMEVLSTREAQEGPLVTDFYQGLGHIGTLCLAWPKCQTLRGKQAFSINLIICLHRLGTVSPPSHLEKILYQARNCLLAKFPDAGQEPALQADLSKAPGLLC